MTDEELRSVLPTLRPKLVAVARRYVKDSDEAEDIVQDTMLRLWVVRDRLIGSPEGFAMVVVKNLSLDYLRKKHRFDSLTDMEKLEMEDMTPAADGESTEEVMRIVSTLPERQQTILRLHDMEGASYEEIATVMGISETALRKTVSRTRLLVRLRYFAAVGAAVVVLLMVTWGWRSWQDMQYLRRYEGSYVMVNGQRNDNLRQIRPQIEDALTQAGNIEHSLDQAFIHEAETDVLNSISDPEERQRLQKLLESEE